MHETQLDPQEARGGPWHEPEVMAQELRASVETSSSELLLGSFLEGSQSFELQLSQPAPSRTQGPRADELVPQAPAPGGLLPTPPALGGSVVHGGGASLGVRVAGAGVRGSMVGAQLCPILFPSPELQLKPASFYQEELSFLNGHRPWGGQRDGTVCPVCASVEGFGSSGCLSNCRDPRLGGCMQSLAHREY